MAILTVHINAANDNANRTCWLARIDSNRPDTISRRRRPNLTAYHHESAYVLAKGRPEKPQSPLPDVQEWTYSGNRFHPTEKAVEVIAPLIRAFSKPGELTLDPFLGSGTTAVAAALTGRNYLGIELERRYCDLAVRRLEGVARFHSAKTSVYGKAA